ncbi:MAG: hypothetical protein LBS81_01060 [Endomicrobium sp.]|nr:hypothetical protein [Endomicrobium sp.]
MYFEAVVIAAPQRTDAKKLIENNIKTEQSAKTKKIEDMQNKTRTELMNFRIMQKCTRIYNKNK